MSVLHRLLDRIYAIYSSRFDPRAQDWRSGLYILAPATPLRHKSFQKTKPLIILKAPPYSRAKLVRLGLEGGKQASLRFLVLSRAWFSIIFIPPLFCISHYFYLFAIIVITTLVFTIFMFLVIMFILYFDYTLSIASLSLCLCISSYSARSGVHGGEWSTLCKHGAYTLFTCGYTLYSGSCGRSRMWHSRWVVCSPLPEYRRT